MARQKLIHLNSGNVNPTGSTNLVEQLINNAGLELGEIAVQHNSGAPKLYIKTGNDSIAEFIDKAAIEAYTINGKKLKDGTEALVLDGSDITVGGEGDYKDSTIASAISAIDGRIDALGTDALEEVEAGNGISVSGKSNHKQTVSANVDETASAGVAVVIDGGSKKIKASVTTVDAAADFTNANSGVTSAKGVKAFVDGEISKLVVTDTAVTGQYVSQVSEADGKIAVVRANIPVMGVKSSEKVVSLDESRNIQTTLAIGYDSVSRKVQLMGIDDEVISEFDASEFIKDGMLHDQKVFTTDASGAAEVTFPKGGTHSYSGLTPKTKYIGLEFSDGAVPTATYTYEALAVGELVDVYTAGNGIEISNANVVSAKVVSENGLSVDASGIKMGIATTEANGAMSSTDKAKLDGIEAGADVNVLEGVQVNGTDLTIGADKKVNVTVTTGTNNGTITVNGTEVAVKGLGSAAYTDSTAYDVAGAAVSAKTEVIGTSDDTQDANTIYGAKAYAKDLVDGKNVSAEGDAYVSASASGNKVTVAATQSTKDSLELADSALQGIAEDKDSGVIVTNKQLDFSGLVINCGTF